MGDATEISKPQGLRLMADYLEGNPEAAARGPVKILSDYVFTRERFVTAAAKLGGPVEVVQEGDRVEARVVFGPVMIYVTIGARELAGPPVIPQVDTAALARDIAAARTEAVEA